MVATATTAQNHGDTGNNANPLLRRSLSFSRSYDWWKQLNREYRVKDKELAILFVQAYNLTLGFKKVIFKHMLVS
jgi:hypothetical protein